MALDKDNPFLKRNLDRLEKRFKGRYRASLEKNLERRDNGKAIHKTVLKSMEDNKKRFLMIRIIRHLLLEEELSLEMEMSQKIT